MFTVSLFYIERENILKKTVSGRTFSMRFSLGTGGAVLLNSRLLMVHHAYDPKVWRIPGGYVKLEEAAHDACIREVFEET